MSRPWRTLIGPTTSLVARLVVAPPPYYRPPYEALTNFSNQELSQGGWGGVSRVPPRIESEPRVAFPITSRPPTTPPVGAPPESSESTR